jgi:XTP/dITP diphosphohydrolase
MQFLLATNNSHKIQEMTQILNGLGIEVITPKQIGINIEVEETGTSFEENAALKSEALFKISGKPSIADDSGICVSALGSRPGVYSARYGRPGMSDKERAEFLLEEMKDKEDRSCFYYCAIAFSTATETFFFRGECHGILAQDYLDGGFGFGYDPVFYFPTIGKRFSEIPAEEKAKYSHRGEAIRKFKEFLESKKHSQIL